MEHRWGTRIEISLPVEVRRNGSDWVRARIEDLSLSGARLRMPALLPALAPLELRIGEETMPAWIVRRTLGGVALEWCQFAPAVVAAILRGSRSRTRPPQLPVTAPPALDHVA